MKRNYCLALILIFVCFALCGCNATTISPWRKQSVANNSGAGTTYTVYICGAVAREGYYEVAEGATYLDVIRKAGILPETFIPNNESSLLDGEQSIIVVNYVENGVECYCHDANDPFFSLRRPTGGLSLEIVNKIADYLETHGTIRNKDVLREVLGDDYENNHYKLFIAEADYEEAH